MWQPSEHSSKGGCGVGNKESAVVVERNMIDFRSEGAETSKQVNLWMTNKEELPICSILFVHRSLFNPQYVCQKEGVTWGNYRFLFTSNIGPEK